MQCNIDLVFFLLLLLLESFFAYSIGNSVHDSHTEADNATKLLSCCQYLDDPHQLKLCVDAYSQEQGRIITAHTAEAREKYQGLTFLLITRATEEIVDYASYSSLLRAFYAHLHNYQIWSVDTSPDESAINDYVLYPKLSFLLQALEAEGERDKHLQWGDYIVWVDSDLIFLNFSRSLNEVVRAHPFADVILSRDVSSAANTGCIIVRRYSRSNWAVDFLHEWLSIRLLNSDWTEQQGLDYLLSEYQHNTSTSSANANANAISIAKEMLLRERLVFVDSNVLNSVAPPMFKQLPSDPVLHLAAESNDLRKAVFSRGAKYACRLLTNIAEDRDSIPIDSKDRDIEWHWKAHAIARLSERQLTLTREILLQTAVQVYGDQFVALLFAIKWTTATMEDMEKLRTISSKYCYSLEATDSEGAIAAQRIRQQIIDKLHHLIATRFELLTQLKDLEAMAQHESFRNEYSAPFGQLLTSAHAIVKAKLLQQSKTKKQQKHIITAVGAIEYCLHNPNYQHLEQLQLHSCVKLLNYHILSDMPEIMKLTVELSYELFWIVGMHNYCEVRQYHDPNVVGACIDQYDADLRSELYKKINNTLKMLLKITSAHQSWIVENMLSSLEDSMSRLLMSELP